MAFFEYAQKTQSNIVPKDEFEEIAQEVFGIIADNLARSLGPMGSSATIIQGKMISATKDGYTILKNYTFHNRYKKMIYNLFLAPCTRLNNTVGDATTTAIVLTNEMFREYRAAKDKMEQHYRLPRHFTAMWDEVIEELKEKIQTQATALDPSDYTSVYNIAYVTSNGNREVSEAMAEVYEKAKTPGIKKKDSPTNKSYIVPINGYDFAANMISDAFVRNEDMSATEKDAMVMVFDHKVGIEVFEKVLEKIDSVALDMKKSLIVVAPFFDAHMCETTAARYLANQKQRIGRCNLIMLQYTMGDMDNHQLEDLVTVLRAKVITEEMEQKLLDKLSDPNASVEILVEESNEDPDDPCYRVIGSAREVYMTCKAGSIFRVTDIESDEEYQNVLRSAEKDLADIIANTSAERQAYASKIYNARARVLQLKMQNYIYYIGADSQLQKQILEDSIDDVIKCLRSATKYGVVPGCQLSILRGCIELSNALDESFNPDTPDPDTILKSFIVNIIYNACRAVYARVIHGPEGKGILKTLPMANMADMKPEEVSKAALTRGNAIIDQSIQLSEVYDMEILEYNPAIITSAETDVMVLSAASELVKILIAGNQCVILDAETDETHEETHRVYV